MWDWTESGGGAEAGKVAPVHPRVSCSVHQGGAKRPIICRTVQIKFQNQDCCHLQERRRTWRQLSPADDSKERWASGEKTDPGFPNQHVSGVEGNVLL